MAEFTLDGATELETIELPAGKLVPNFWSPDGRLISGYLRGPNGAHSGVGVYDLESGEGRQLSADRGLGWAPWLPDSKRVIYFTIEGELVVIEVEVPLIRRSEIPPGEPLAVYRDTLVATAVAVAQGTEEVSTHHLHLASLPVQSSGDISIERPHQTGRETRAPQRLREESPRFQVVLVEHRRAPLVREAAMSIPTPGKRRKQATPRRWEPPRRHPAADSGVVLASCPPQRLSLGERHLGCPSQVAGPGGKPGHS
jgi:hypothetical protein